jgi:hypothetical protein
MGIFADIWDDAGWLVEVIGGGVIVLAGGYGLVQFAASPNIGAVVGGTMMAGAVMAGGGALVYKGIVKQFYAEYSPPTSAECASNKVANKTNTFDRVVYGTSCGFWHTISFGLGGNNCMKETLNYVNCGRTDGYHMTSFGNWAKDDVGQSIIPYSDIVLAAMAPLFIFDGLLLFFEGEGFNFLGRDNFWLAVTGAQFIMLGSAIVFDILNSIFDFFPNVDYTDGLFMAGAATGLMGSSAGLYLIVNKQASAVTYGVTAAYAALTGYMIYRRLQDPRLLFPVDGGVGITGDNKETCKRNGGTYIKDTGKCFYEDGNNGGMFGNQVSFQTRDVSKQPVETEVNQNTTGSGLNTGNAKKAGKGK